VAVPSRIRTRLAVIAGACTVFAAVIIPVTITANAAVPPPPAGWTQIWADDFNGSNGSLPSGANWQFDIGHAYPGGPPNWGTGEIAAHTNNPANVSVDGAGNLRITPRRDGAGNWTSARIETHKSDFKPPTNGVMRVEARIQMPNVTGQAALGYWPAFWMLGSPYRGNWWNWPGIGEFDIMENVNGINSVWGVLHCGVNPGGPCNETTGIAANRACPGSSCQSAFHTYRFEWDRSVNPNQLRWYVDGQQFHQVSQNQFDAGTWANMTNHAGYFIILNVAIGGAFPNALAGQTPVAATASGVPMVVDYVAVWTRGGGGTTPPPTTPPPTCGPLISQNRRVSASSIESPNQAAAFAVDGNTGTRWSSAHNEPNWIQVDLGSAQPITRVRLNWEVAYGRAYSIQLSSNGSTWTDAFTTFGGAGGMEDLNVSGTARYVRMNGINRATVYGFSLWEFQVFGGCGTTPPPTNPPPGGTWAPNTAYAVGAQVSYGGINYRCQQAHTSIVTWEPPNAPSLWQRL
jgi:beta-glucanase (GH16 family)